MDEQEQKRNLIPLKRALVKGGFGKTKAYALIDQGKIIAYKMDGKTMIDADSIDAYHSESASNYRAASSRRTG